MRRYTHCATIPMAEGDAEPTWLLPDVRPRFATWSLCGGRPFGCGEDCKRWHAGVDLVGAKQGDLVVAPESGTLVRLDAGWSQGTRAVFMRTDSGLFLVLGGTIAGSGKEFEREAGARVARGDAVGRVLGSYGMIHFETYADPDAKRTHNSRWYLGDAPPEGLRNPLNYVQRAAGVTTTMDTYAQRQQALLDLGYHPDPAGEPWGERSKKALQEAQRALGLEGDGIWGPKTEEAIRAALDERIEEEAGECGPEVAADCNAPLELEDEEVSEETSESVEERAPSRPMTVALGVASVAAVLGGIALFARSVRRAPSSLEGIVTTL